MPVSALAIADDGATAAALCVGTDAGRVLAASLGGASTTGVGAHEGPVSAAAYHPTHGARLLLTASYDWTCRLWWPGAGAGGAREAAPARTATGVPSSGAPGGGGGGGSRPLKTFSGATDYVFDAAWCPTCPALFAAVDATGCLALWSVFGEAEVPAARVEVSRGALSRLAWADSGRRVAVGDAAGALVVYDFEPQVQALPRMRGGRGETVWHRAGVDARGGPCGPRGASGGPRPRRRLDGHVTRVLQLELVFLPRRASPAARPPRVPRRARDRLTRPPRPLRPPPRPRHRRPRQRPSSPCASSSCAPS